MKTIKGFVEKKDLARWEADPVLLIVSAVGNIVESDDRVPCTLTIDEPEMNQHVSEPFREILRGIWNINDRG